MRIRSQTAQSHIANSVGCILPPLIGALRNPASHLLLFPNKGYVKLSASTRGWGWGMGKYMQDCGCLHLHNFSDTSWPHISVSRHSWSYFLRWLTPKKIHLRTGRKGMCDVLLVRRENQILQYFVQPWRIQQICLCAASIWVAIDSAAGNVTLLFHPYYTQSIFSFHLRPLCQRSSWTASRVFANNLHWCKMKHDMYFQIQVSPAWALTSYYSVVIL